jgi:FMN phosphatase YigB (HAD superfamily)
MELGLRTIWINRRGQTGDPPPTRELSDLGRLPDTLDELVSA